VAEAGKIVTIMAKKIGALWVRKKNDGDVYMSGVIDLGPIHGELQIVAWKNDRKEKKEHPDYVINLSQPRKEAEEVNIEPVDVAMPVQNKKGMESEIDVSDIPY
jgi:uncharacterized protein (DUF736 family)